MIPRRIKQQTGRYALVDGIPFALPVNSERAIRPTAWPRRRQHAAAFPRR